jgi:signal peptidase II
VDDVSRSRTYAFLLVAAGAVVALDQITKSLALSALRDGPIDLIGGAVTLNLTFNPGGAFGILQGLPGFFLVATILVIILILVWAHKLEDQRWAIPLGMVLGGGLGNVIDRIFRDTDGRVVDFIDFHWWPVFNLADASIVVGITIILLLSARPRARPEAEVGPT